MRVWVLLLAAAFILSGCSVQIQEYSLNEEYNETTKEIIHTIYFTLYNPSFKPAYCNATLDLGNKGRNYVLGEIPPRSKEGRIVRFDMPEGNTTFSLNTSCSFK